MKDNELNYAARSSRSERHGLSVPYLKDLNPFQQALVKAIAAEKLNAPETRRDALGQIGSYVIDDEEARPLDYSTTKRIRKRPATHETDLKNVDLAVEAMVIFPLIQAELKPLARVIYQMFFLGFMVQGRYADESLRLAIPVGYRGLFPEPEGRVKNYLLSLTNNYVDRSGIDNLSDLLELIHDTSQRYYELEIEHGYRAIADALDVHETTVARIIEGKIIPLIDKVRGETRSLDERWDALK